MRHFLAIISVTMFIVNNLLHSLQTSSVLLYEPVYLRMVLDYCNPVSICDPFIWQTSCHSTKMPKFTGAKLKYMKSLQLSLTLFWWRLALLAPELTCYKSNSFNIIHNNVLCHVTISLTAITIWVRVRVVKLTCA